MILSIDSNEIIDLFHLRPDLPQIFVFQYNHLIPEFSALENVMMPMLIAKKSRAAAKERALELLSAVGLADRRDNRPNQLSGGQNQRVAVARALANGPSIVIGDELTGNLDTKPAWDALGGGSSGSAMS